MFVKNKKYKGFTLIEMVVAIFVFSLIITSVIGTFVSVVNLRKKTKTIQQNTENARFALEQMAKTLRTSSIQFSNATSIQAFDYSQEQCIKYNYDVASHTLQAEIGNNTELDLNNPPACDFSSASYVDMVSSAIGDVSFDVHKSTTTPAVRGRVTIALEVCYDSNNCTGANKVDIQTTVSLRDYN